MECSLQHFADGQVSVTSATDSSGGSGDVAGCVLAELRYDSLLDNSSSQLSWPTQVEAGVDMSLA